MLAGPELGEPKVLYANRVAPLVVQPKRVLNAVQAPWPYCLSMPPQLKCRALVFGPPRGLAMRRGLVAVGEWKVSLGHRKIFKVLRAPACSVAAAFAEGLSIMVRGV